MAQNLRLNQIAELLSTQGPSTVEDLAQRFGVSDMTIRRDLRALADAGRVIRTHGGAAPAERVSFEFEFLHRLRSNALAKASIGATAASLVPDNKAVMLDSGTTTLALARHLKDRKNLTVITTSLAIASELQFCTEVTLLLLGGFLRRNSPDLMGPLTEQNLEGLRADMAFLGADGVSLRGELFNADFSVARMLQRMVASAETVYIVADSSKLGRTAMARYGTATRCAGVITDANADPAIVKTLRRAGINIITAPVSKETHP